MKNQHTVMRTVLNPCTCLGLGRLLRKPHVRALAATMLLSAFTFGASAGSPVVANVTAAQRPGTNIVDIHFDLSDPDSTNVNIGIAVSKDSGATWTVPASTVFGDFGPVTATPTTKSVTWYAGKDWDGHYTANCRVRVYANDSGLVLIPPGSYLRGNFVASQGSGDPDITDAPQYPVYVSAFLMDSTPVTGGRWNLVKEGYADAHGYVFEDAGSFKAPDHPVQTVNWLDAVKWCNARSEMEGATPVYYTDGTYSTVLRTGTAASTIPHVKPGANGYRLPTEAEWEKAARGGLTSTRFPQLYFPYPFYDPSFFDVITTSHANYYGEPNAFSYDGGPNGYNSYYATGSPPYTTPSPNTTIPQVRFYPNTYGLYDMAGNVFEWCGDWYGTTYYAPGQSDPQGPSTGSYRVLRGGSWYANAGYCRCASRFTLVPQFANWDIGFRCVRGL